MQKASCAHFGITSISWSFFPSSGLSNERDFWAAWAVPSDPPASGIATTYITASRYLGKYCITLSSSLWPFCTRWTHIWLGTRASPHSTDGGVIEPAFAQSLHKGTQSNNDWPLRICRSLIRDSDYLRARNSKVRHKISELKCNDFNQLVELWISAHDWSSN